jgi:hypothetical protein
MGFLDNTTITVDAILTKQGRKELAQGRGLGISKFAVSDDGIDYRLYNPDHPSGSNSYASAITSLPLTEATPDDYTTMTYKLTTLNRQVKFLPKLRLVSGEKNILFDRNSQGKSVKIEIATDNYPGSESYEFLLTDSTNFALQGGTAIDISGNIGFAPAAQDIPQAVIVRGTNVVQVSPMVRKGLSVTAMIKITGMDSGAHLNVLLQLDDNLLS